MLYGKLRYAAFHLNSRLSAFGIVDLSIGTIDGFSIVEK